MKSKPKNIVGLPKPIAPKFPIMTLNPPTYGPSMIPIIGAKKVGERKESSARSYDYAEGDES